VRGAARRLSLSEFTNWVDAVLEAASHVPPHPAREQVTILPLSQMLARPFAALVLPGCDDVRLPAAPEPPGPWTATQRLALGLPSRAELGGAQRAAWAYALQAPACDILWRQGDDSGEPLLPSPLVQALLLEGLASEADDPRAPRELTAAPVPPPTPTGAALPLKRLSASAYATCAPAPTASSRCANWACRKPTSWTPRSTSATSAWAARRAAPLSRGAAAAPKRTQAHGWP
jgi:ATP-dependent helicase/nuclease subunit B